MAAKLETIYKIKLDRKFKHMTHISARTKKFQNSLIPYCLRHYD